MRRGRWEGSGHSHDSGNSQSAGKRRRGRRLWLARKLEEVRLLWEWVQGKHTEVEEVTLREHGIEPSL